MRMYELREKEVINLCDCRKLGCVTDLILDMCKGSIKALIIPEAGRFGGFFGYDSEYVIPFECIRNIGPDVITVEICAEKCLKSCKD